jgi:hypothetical protein
MILDEKPSAYRFMPWAAFNTTQAALRFGQFHELSVFLVEWIIFSLHDSLRDYSGTSGVTVRRQIGYSRMWER